jgi:hypothetical protein
MTVYISPYRRMTSLREAMNRLMEDSIAETSPSEREMMLAVDVQAEDEAFVITDYPCAVNSNPPKKKTSST